MNKQEFPSLAYLIEAYYFLNWDEVYGPAMDDPLRDLMTTEEPSTLLAIRDDIDRFLTSHPTESEAKAFLNAFDLGPMTQNVREFLVHARDTLETATKR